VAARVTGGGEGGATTWVVDVTGAGAGAYVVVGWRSAGWVDLTARVTERVLGLIVAGGGLSEREIEVSTVGLVALGFDETVDEGALPQPASVSDTISNTDAAMARPFHPKTTRIPSPPNYVKVLLAGRSMPEDARAVNTAIRARAANNAWPSGHSARELEAARATTWLTVLESRTDTEDRVLPHGAGEEALFVRFHR
jgi:hypothetical protein